MLRIALHSNIQERKEIEPVLTAYLTEKKIAFEIYHVDSVPEFLSYYFSRKEFKLLLICENKELSYIIKIYHNFDKNYMHTISGILELPLTPDSIEKKLFNNIENTYICPYGVYNVSTRAVCRKILHEDIEFIKRIKNKSVIYLRNGDTEETNKSVNKIKKELNERYFIICRKGYMVNIFNINKVNKDTHIIELKSGTKIPLTKRNFQVFLKEYIFSTQGINIW